MLSQKDSLILKLLYEKSPAYLTSQEVSAKLYISDKTARKYLQEMKDIMLKHGADIEGKRGYGYRLIVRDDQTFERFYQDEVTNISLNQSITSIHESKDRQYYILHQLFFEQASLRVNDISDQLFVSRSTVSNDLIDVKKKLKPYDILLKSKTNKGIYLEGREQDFRHFIMDYFFMNRLQDNFYAFSKYENLLEGISIEEIVIIVLDECREAQLKLSDFIIFNIVLHICLAIKRIQAGFEVEPINIVEFPHDSVEYKTALKIIKRITESIVAIEFPPEEANYIAVHLRNKIATRKVFQRTPFDEKQIKEQLLQALRGLDEETGYDLSNDSILIDGLMMHFVPFLTRLQNNTSIKNPLLKDIKEKYSKLLLLTKKYFSQMPVFQTFQVTESEWAYLTIHLTAAVERYFNEQKAQVLVICATGLGSSQMLKTRLEHELGSKISIQKVISYYEISDEELEEIDLIISSISLPNVIHNNIPIVHVSVFLDKADIKAIDYELSKIKGLQQLLSDNITEKTNKNEQIRLIKKNFKSELFFKIEGKSDKKKVLEILLKGIENIEGRPIRKALEKQLQLRESYSSVVFSPRLAVPHPIESVTESAHVAIAAAPEGIHWDDEYDNVQLVFLLSPDRLNLSEMEKVSPLLVPMIEDDDFCSLLVASNSFEDFIDRFIDYYR